MMNQTALRKRDWHSLNIFLKVLLAAVAIGLFTSKFVTVDVKEYLGEYDYVFTEIYLHQNLFFLLFVSTVYLAIMFFLIGEDLVNNRLMSVFIIVFALMHFLLSSIWALYIMEIYTVPLGNYLLLTIFPLVTLIYFVQQERRKSLE